MQLLGERVRTHFTFPQAGRIVMNNAASTQPPRELVALYRSLAPRYENVHRGQSSASQEMTGLFEEAYNTEFRDGDNVATTASNTIPTSFPGTP
jgi:selenocysteine lyase/cysteine desulfurase